ncbi:MAG: hypothetical protein KKH88_00595 [Nanoarchaeota archaeon]|nr:hypothetical protein [Nanoarchaeota archaeon]
MSGLRTLLAAGVLATMLSAPILANAVETLPYQDGTWVAGDFGHVIDHNPHRYIPFEKDRKVTPGDLLGQYSSDSLEAEIRYFRVKGDTLLFSLDHKMGTNAGVTRVIIDLGAGDSTTFFPGLQVSHVGDLEENLKQQIAKLKVHSVDSETDEAEITFSFEEK